MELWLGNGNIDTDFRITLVSFQNALPDLLDIVNITHKAYAFYYKPA